MLFLDLSSDDISNSADGRDIEDSRLSTSRANVGPTTPSPKGGVSLPEIRSCKFIKDIPLSFAKSKTVKELDNTGIRKSGDGEDLLSPVVVQEGPTTSQSCREQLLFGLEDIQKGSQGIKKPEREKGEAILVQHDVEECLEFLNSGTSFMNVQNRITTRQVTKRQTNSPINWLSHLKCCDSPFMSKGSSMQTPLNLEMQSANSPIDTIIDVEAILMKSPDFREYLRIREKQRTKN